jgi:hypothetical protein
MMVNRIKLREALAAWDGFTYTIDDKVLIVEAAREYADGGTLVISKVDGEWPWPEDVLETMVLAWVDSAEPDDSDWVRRMEAILDALLEGSGTQ